jgi:hypothetical protein
MDTYRTLDTRTDTLSYGDTVYAGDTAIWIRQYTSHKERYTIVWR